MAVLTNWTDYALVGTFLIVIVPILPDLLVTARWNTQLMIINTGGIIGGIIGDY